METPSTYATVSVDGRTAVVGVYHVPRVYNYAIRLEYAEEQIRWLDKLGPEFEAAVVKHRVLDFTRALYERWFKQWAERSPEGIACVEGSSKVYQRKIEIFTSFIMGLHDRWIRQGLLLPDWSPSDAFDALDDLEDMITHEFWKIQPVFGLVPWVYEYELSDERQQG
ncbi:hypothetical protein ARMSODRAFT_1023250 [Armillaria solidipes]|uniref:Uncharacterized protein n=1 Tax=Armillaria solidipes TaxID=1076256 RepID=A0A2H3BMV5_9AGAR|nr:hypothetical protein ARMSODRAFT_1023250 [Armillaria solidipes]